MKKYLALAISMMLVLGTIAMAAPQDKAKPAGEKKAGDKMDKMEKKSGDKMAAKAMTANGTVTSKTVSEITVKGAKDTWTFAHDGKTKMSGNIKEGSMVTVKYTEKDGKKMATSIAAKAAAGAKKNGDAKKPAAKKPA